MVIQAQIYEVQNIKDARKYLLQISYAIVLTNPQGSTRYYGMRTIDYIFKALQREFPNKIKAVVVNVCGDYPALITARKLGYHNILADENKTSLSVLNK